jgi:glycosyltransferase involved in cell wall biosynthesis
MSIARLLFVEASVGGVVGGSLTGILHLVRHLDRRRFAPEMVLYEEKPSLSAGLLAEGIPTHVLPGLPTPTSAGRRGVLGRALIRAADLFGVIGPRARALGAVLRERQPRLVYLANGVTANLDGIVAAARVGLPVICHEKGFRRVGPIERLAARRVEVCIAMTDDIARHYQGLGLRPKRWVTIYDGIDRQEFSPGGGPAIRAEFGIPADAPVVGIVGHLQEWKGQHLVLEAVARARRVHPTLRCLVVGGVHRSGREYAEALRRRIAEPDLAGHVVLTGERADVAACLDAMDVAIHGSIRPEPFGRVMIEAMALGRPVVAPREGGPLDIVVDGETGLLVTPRDPDAMAAAISTLVADPARREAMGRAARQRVDAVFDIRHHVRAIEDLFDEVLGSPARGAGRRQVA